MDNAIVESGQPIWGNETDDIDKTTRSFYLILFGLFLPKMEPFEASLVAAHFAMARLDHLCFEQEVQGSS
jgi:hypothetical protein